MPDVCERTTCQSEGEKTIISGDCLWWQIINILHYALGLSCLKYKRTAGASGGNATLNPVFATVLLTYARFGNWNVVLGTCLFAGTGTGTWLILSNSCLFAPLLVVFRCHISPLYKK
jgi:hypothetical protein